MRIRGGRSSVGPRNWLRDNWQYIVLVVVAAVTIFLVALALNRPVATSTPSTPTPIPTTTPSPEEPSPSPSPSPTTTTPSPTVAFLGDSYSVGTGATTSTNRWTTQLAAANGWRELNFGVEGTGYAADPSTRAPSYADFVDDVVAADPDVVVVSGGRFDFSSSASPGDVSEAIRSTYSALRTGLPQAQIIAVGPIWDATEAPERIDEIATEIQTAVESVDGSFADIGQPLAGQVDLIGPDGLVPNDAGYLTLVSAIGAAVAPLVSDVR